MFAHTTNSSRPGWLGALQRNRRRRRRKPSVHCLPQVAALEARTLLSTITVTNDSDSGAGSLRAALGAKVAGETINFAPSAYGTITLSSGPLEVATSVTVQGPGPKKVTINGDNAFEAPCSRCQRDGHHLRPDIHGGAGAGKLIRRWRHQQRRRPDNRQLCGHRQFDSLQWRRDQQQFQLDRGKQCRVQKHGPRRWWYIEQHRRFVLAVSGSTITDNTAPTSDGFGGGINNVGTATITGSVMSNNSGANGGGVFSGYLLGPAAVTITGSTVNNNSGYSGGGLELQFSTATITGNAFSEQHRRR